MKSEESQDQMRRDELSDLIHEIRALRSELIAVENKGLAQTINIHSSYRDSARNLLHYLALRGQDIRPLQERLTSLGLSSFGRSEAHVLATVDAVWNALHHLARHDLPPQDVKDTPIDFRLGKRLLARHTESLLGPKPDDRSARIMVTLPSEAAQDPGLPRALLAAGMDCARINCAHDDFDAWKRMIAHLRSAQQDLGKPCKLLMDLAGPKLRTGPVSFSAQVLKWRPQRNEYGRVTAPASICLVPQGFRTEVRPGVSQLPVPADWLAKVRVGDRIELVDARGARRFLWVVGEDGDSRWAEAVRTAYVTPGTGLHLTSSDGPGDREFVYSALVDNLPTTNQALTVRIGDPIVLTRTSQSNTLDTYDREEQNSSPPRISCTLPEIFDDVRAGERIWFDDGKIGGLIETVNSQEILVRVTHAPSVGAKLRGDKGINLPDSSLTLPALTAKDLSDLPFVAAHADLVGYSFVRSAADVVELEDRLVQLGGDSLGIVLKIETRRAFEELPSLVLAAMRSPCDGVMIARGDLAIECGYERLAEVQEQILWICEAAHVPVIWATQVLENLAKDGQPSRAEISDAAIGQRAECVMLNKGTHIIKAVQSLADILRRMEAHQSKKQSTLRPLDIARRFLANVTKSH